MKSGESAYIMKVGMFLQVPMTATITPQIPTGNAGAIAWRLEGLA